MTPEQEFARDLRRLLAAPTENFLELVRIGGFDPKTDFRFKDLRDLDLAGLDLRDFDFRDSDLSGSDLRGTKLTEALLAGADRSLCLLQDAPYAPELVVIPAGEFWMGSGEGERGSSDDERPRHRVTLASFALGRFPVTFGEYDYHCDEMGWDSVLDNDWGRGKHPVINVYWNDTLRYSDWLSDKTGKLYRLPSEAEWEYACRAGTTTPYWWGDRSEPGRSGNYSFFVGGTTEVGRYPPNPFGLYDMSGNVREWVDDVWCDNYMSVPRDGSSNKEGNAGRRVVRGGSWGDDPSDVRSASRDSYTKGYGYIYHGFRVARTITSQTFLLRTD